MQKIFFLGLSLLLFAACQSKEQEQANTKNETAQTAQQKQEPVPTKKEIHLPLQSFQDTTTYLYGYEDAKHNIVIKAQYAMAFTDQFDKFAHIASEEGKLYAINTEGKILYEILNYDNGPDYASEGLYRILDGDKIGYADAEQGTIIIAPTYKRAFPFENGLAKVTDQNGDTYYINKKGEIQK